MNVDKMFTSSTFYEEAWQDSVPTLSTSFNNGITCKYKLDTTESSEDCIYDRLSYYNGLFYYPSGEMYCWAKQRSKKQKTAFESLGRGLPKVLRSFFR